MYFIHVLYLLIVVRRSLIFITYGHLVYIYIIDLRSVHLYVNATDTTIKDILMVTKKSFRTVTLQITHAETLI